MAVAEVDWQSFQFKKEVDELVFESFLETMNLF